jgi:hypothetical protein
MSPWLIAAAAGLLVAFVQYGWRDARRDGFAALAALLRVAAVTLLVALLLDAPAARAKPVTMWAAIDGSLSMLRDARDSAVWRAARDSVRRLRAESTFVFGDSARRGDTVTAPHDLSSSLRPIAERALGAGHPLTIVTDGELDDPETARSLPPASRLIVIGRPARRDLAVMSIDLPRAVVSGDTVDFKVTVAAGSGGARAGTLTVMLENAVVATARIDSLRAFAERAVDFHSPIDGPAGARVLRAIVVSPDDVEQRNDTLSVGIDLSRAASAVFLSTSPDFDARYALSVLRGALGIPTRGFFRVAPGEWRIEGALTPISEADVRQALREAPVAILHGDTAAFGPPRTVTAGPLALIPPVSATEGEWYPSSAPTSPLAPALSGVVWDSLPPVAVSSTVPKGSWDGVEARRARGDERRALVVGTDEPRRVVVVAASGLWRWRFRGGVSSDAFTALWGSIFDWLAAERADNRAAVPDERVLRAGQPIRWRRGSPNDSIVTVTMKRRDANGQATARVDSMTIRFGRDANIVETPGVAAGIYDVGVRGGSTLLAVNPSREWLPRAPGVASGAARTSGALSADTAPRLRSMGWAYAVAIVLLCIEWILRRRRGMR